MYNHRPPTSIDPRKSRCRDLRSRSLLAALVLGMVSAPVVIAQPEAVPPPVQAVLDRVSADSLRGHLSFIASDLLEGRATPSPGLDIAAEYIAAQFRRAGLEPVGDDGYFQTAEFVTVGANPDAFELTIRYGDEALTLDFDQVTMPLDQKIELADLDIVKVPFGDESTLEGLTKEQVSGKAVITVMPNVQRRGRRGGGGQLFEALRAFTSKMQELEARIILSVGGDGTGGGGAGRGRGRRARLIDPKDQQSRGRRGRGRGPALLQVTARDEQLTTWYQAAPAGKTGGALSLTSIPKETPVPLRNVVGLLRGSDPVLKDTYVLVTAHYDHVGVLASGEGDRIKNGANDDGSGTVGVIELASVLATLKERPKRSLVFMAVFGEEIGLLGSRYYGRNPIFPIEKTVANINLEQIGRTDSTEGDQINNATLTGFDYTDLGEILTRAGELTGIELYKHPRNSDAYFGRSDNQALADQGVPAHTLCVAFNYPDYHGVGDHWDKIDYDNMAKVVRMVALGLVMIADDPEEPRWNADNPRTERYIQAWKDRRGK